MMDEPIDQATKPVRIAVAEDEPDVRRAFVALLKAMGYDVVGAAANGAELLEQCREIEVDVVFVDLDMPVMDGLTVAQEITGMGIPVVLISGHPDAEHVVLDAEPVVARISKPASLDSVRRAIEAALDHRKRTTSK